VDSSETRPAASAGTGSSHRIAKRRVLRYPGDREDIGRGERPSFEVAEKSAADEPDVAQSAAWRSKPQPWKPGGLAIASVGYILAISVISALRLKAPRHIVRSASFGVLTGVWTSSRRQ